MVQVRKGLISQTLAQEALRGCVTVRKTSRCTPPTSLVPSIAETRKPAEAGIACWVARSRGRDANELSDITPEPVSVPLHRPLGTDICVPRHCAGDREYPHGAGTSHSQGIGGLSRPRGFNKKMLSFSHRVRSLLFTTSTT